MRRPTRARPTTPEREAAKVLETYEIVRPPVPVAEIAKRMGFRVVYEPFDGDVSGMLYREQGDDDSVIVVNTLNAKVRQRFTIAHEIGHHVLHDNVLFVDKPVAVRFRDSRSSLAISLEEIQANKFAACLLMPELWVIEEANRELARDPSVAGEELVERLARTFDVSRQAMEFRLGDLGVWGPL